MAPLVVLLGTFLSLLAARAAGLRSRLSVALAGCIAMAAMLVLTGTSHFVMTGELLEMLPPALPARTELVWATGVLELLAAIGLLVPRTRRATGVCLAVFYVAVLPANVYAAMHGLGPGDHGPGYLAFRVPLQLLFIGWALWFTRPVDEAV
jgi:uncharacterized membrane protein